MSRKVTLQALRQWSSLPDPSGGGDKESRGRVVVVGGGAAVPGAPLLTGEAALRVGAGKLALATIGSIAVAMGLKAPEARVVALPEKAGEISSAAAEALAEPIKRADAVVVGPGMLDEAAACELVLKLLEAKSEAAFVLDAAAMTGLMGHSAAVKSTGRPLVLTPHPGEMAALLGQDKAEVERRPADCAREVAEALGAVVALKDAATHIVTPTGDAWVHEQASTGLGTAGSGDVLAGVIGGLLARGLEPEAATVWGVWLHGAAGCALEARLGPTGYLARELPAELPGLLASAR